MRIEIISAVIILIGLIFRSWFFSPGTLSSGDWPYLFKEAVQDFSFTPNPDFLWLGPYYQWTLKIFVQFLNVPWEVYERIFWFWPFLLLSILSSYYLTKSWIGVLIYTTNTYILMVVGGGQMGIAMAYSIVPFAFKKFIDFTDSNFSSAQNKKIFKESIILGLVLAVLTMFDPRVAYIALIAIVIYTVFSLKYKTNFIPNAFNLMLYAFLIPLAITVLINLYWIIPLFLGNLSQEYKGLDNVADFKFLSFADFSHTFGLLHPNWPENIFGKTYFMQPEFIILPILAFSALLLIKDAQKKLSVETKNIYFFIFLCLVGAFLAKGVNEPFGELNSWLFKNFPGMNMFRDASKFYLLIILGYCFLIPFALKNISKKIPFGKLFSPVFILLWCILIWHAISGQLGGTFKPKSIPGEYIELKQYILSEPQNSNFLWIPSRPRFGFSANSHLGISGSDILGSSDPLFMVKVISSDKDRAFYSKLKKLKIDKIIVPYDSDKELFILDRKYSDLLRDKVVMELDKIEWLIKIPKFSNVVIYKVE